MTQPEDSADRIIDLIEALGCQILPWQANLLREWWSDPATNLCTECHRPTDRGSDSLCAICDFRQRYAWPEIKLPMMHSEENHDLSGRS